MQSVFRVATVLVFMVFAISIKGAVLSYAIQDSDEDLTASMAAKIASVAAYGLAPQEESGARRTRVSDAELNAFLNSSIVVLPEALAQPRFTFIGEGALLVEAVVDLDMVGERPTAGPFDPLSLLSGQLPVKAAAVIDSADGLAKINIDYVEIGGIRIPHGLARELIAGYTGSVDRPKGVDVDLEYSLPHRILAIHVRPGEAVIIQ
jgi:hypothetical protein